MTDMNEWPFRILEGGILSSMGVDIGPAPRVVKDENGYMAVKVRGHTTWQAIGAPRRYVPAAFYVFLVVSREGDKVILRRLMDFKAAGL